MIQGKRLTGKLVTDWFVPRAMVYWLAGWGILAFALRLATIQRYSLWFDEAISYHAATLPLPLIFNNAVQSSHPPLYYLLLHYWLPLWPDHDLFLRLFSLYWGMLLLPVLYWLSSQLLAERCLALLATVFVIVSPFHIAYSMELRMYTLLMFLVVLAAGAYLMGRKTGRLGWWLLFGFASLGAIYTHLFAWLFLAAIGIHALVGWRERRSLALTIIVGMGLLVLFLPWLLVLMAEPAAGSGSLRPLMADVSLVVFDPIKPLTTLLLLLFGIPFTILYAGLGLFLILTLITVASLELSRSWPKGAGEKLLLPIAVIVSVIGIPTVVYYFRPFFLPERSMAAALPFLSILLAWGVSRRHALLPLLAVTVFLMMLVGSWQHLTGEPTKLQYQQAMAYVNEAWQPGDTVVHLSDYSYLPALRYIQLPRHVSLEGGPGSLKPDAALAVMGGSRWAGSEIKQAGGRVWLILALMGNVDWQQEQIDYFITNYERLEWANIGGVEVLLFQISP